VEREAKMGGFNGWSMPLYYTSVMKEHRWCRRKAALFDTCHMGEVSFKGDVKKSGIEFSCTQNLSDMEICSARYGFFLNDDAGILDDFISFRKSESDFLFVINSSSSEKIIENIKLSLKSGELKDISQKCAKIDLQGPLSAQVIKDTLGFRKSLKFFTFSRHSIGDTELMISRTGYTGELGFEIYCDSGSAVKVWRKLLDDGRVQPAGLGARDLLRLEMGFPLYGADIDEKTSPLEAGMKKFIDFRKNFRGKDSLEKGEGKAAVRRSAFKTNSKRSPRRGFEICSNGKKIGYVTSGGYSPVLECGIGMGYISSRCCSPGTEIEIGSGRKRLKGCICELPFYEKGSFRIPMEER